MAGRWETTPGDPWHVILYIDDRATARAEGRARRRVSRPRGRRDREGLRPNIVEVYAVKSARIELDHTPARERIDVPPYLTVQTREAVPHDFTVTCGIPGHDHPGQEIRAEIFRYQAPPLDWDVRGKCGFSTDFAYSSAC